MPAVFSEQLLTDLPLLASPEGLRFGEHGFFRDREKEGVAEFEAGIAGGVGRQRTNVDGFAADDDGGAILTVTVEQIVGVAAEIEFGVGESSKGDADFNADTVLVGGKSELDGAVAAADEVVASQGPGGFDAMIGRRGGEERMGAAEASPTRREDEEFVRALGVGGMGIEATDEALGFRQVGESGLH